MEFLNIQGYLLEIVINVGIFVHFGIDLVERCPKRGDLGTILGILGP